MTDTYYFDAENGIEYVHLLTPDGCKVSVNGQGHFPCNIHPGADMSENLEEIPDESVEAAAQDDGDEDPDSLVGEEVEPEHTLDVDSFDEEDEA